MLLSIIKNNAFNRRYLYKLGYTYGYVIKGRKFRTRKIKLSGKLVRTQHNWVILHVPKPLINGLVKSLNIPGLVSFSEATPYSISGAIVFTPEEVKKINFQTPSTLFQYTLGRFMEIKPKSGPYERIWVCSVHSPELKALRREQYGLPSYPSSDDFFILPVAALPKPHIRKTASSKLSNDNINKVEIKPSKIDGYGIHATEDIKKDEIIVSDVIVLVKKKHTESGYAWDLSEEGRYINHSFEPNAYLKRKKDSADLIALRDIKQGEEITVDCTNLDTFLLVNGKDAPLYYRGRPYLGESSSGRIGYPLHVLLEFYDRKYNNGKHKNLIKEAVSVPESVVVPSGIPATGPAIYNTALQSQGSWFSNLFNTVLQLFIYPYIRNLAESEGYLFYPGEGDLLSRYRTFRKFYGGYQAAYATEDDPIIRNILRNLVFWSKQPKNLPELIEAIEQSENAFALSQTILPFIRMLSPALFEKLYGLRGSPKSLAPIIHDLYWSTRSPTTGVLGISPEEAAREATELFNVLYGPDVKRPKTFGYTAGEIGSLYNLAAKLNMIPRFRDMPINEKAERLSNIARLMSALREFSSEFTKAGMHPNLIRRGPSDAIDYSILSELLFGTGLENLPPELASHILRMLTSYAYSGPKLLEQLAIALRTRSLLRDSVYPAFVAQALTGSLAAGEAIRQLAGTRGISGLSYQQMLDLDTRLRVQAAGSRFANMLGATMALYEAGLIDKDTPAYDIVRAIQEKRPVLPDGTPLVSILPWTWARIMVESGIPYTTAVRQFLATKTNQDFVFKYKLMDLVRNIQGPGEVFPLLNVLAAQALRAYFMSRPDGIFYQQDIPRLAHDIVKAMVTGPDPSLYITNRKKYIDELKRKISSWGISPIDEIDSNVMLNHVLTHIDHFIRTYPRYRFYGNLPSLLYMHRPELLQSANRIASGVASEAKFREEAADILQYTWLQRLTDMLSKADIDKPPSLRKLLLESISIPKSRFSPESFPWESLLDVPEAKLLSSTDRNKILSDLKYRLLPIFSHSLEPGTVNANK